MNTPTCSLGIDFGTESGRAVLVDVSNGEVLASHVTPYAHGVITERLPHAESNSFVPSIPRITWRCFTVPFRLSFRRPAYRRSR